MIGPLSALVLAAALQAPPAAPVQERLVEVIVHGNHTTPDADIAAAGLKSTKTGVTFSPGKPIPDGLVKILALASRRDQNL